MKESVLNAALRPVIEQIIKMEGKYLIEMTVTKIDEHAPDTSEEEEDTDQTITDEEIGQIAKNFTSEQVITIAENYLTLVVKKEGSENQWNFNYNTIKDWQRTSRLKNARKVMIEAFSNAAKDDVVEIEQIPRTLQDEEAPKPTELTDDGLLHLSQRITETTEIKVLAIDGLKMENYKVDRHIINHQPDIPAAAHGVLKEWRKSQTNDQEAYVKICKALKKTNMAYYIDNVLHKTRKDEKRKGRGRGRGKKH